MRKIISFVILALVIVGSGWFIERGEGQSFKGEIIFDNSISVSCLVYGCDGLCSVCSPELWLDHPKNNPGRYLDPKNDKRDIISVDFSKDRKRLFLIYRVIPCVGFKIEVGNERCFGQPYMEKQVYGARPPESGLYESTLLHEDPPDPYLPMKLIKIIRGAIIPEKKVTTLEWIRWEKEND